MPKWIDLNEMDDDDILLKKNRLSQNFVSEADRTEPGEYKSATAADAYEDDFLDAMEPAKKSMTIFFPDRCVGQHEGDEDWFPEQHHGGTAAVSDRCGRGVHGCEGCCHEVFHGCGVGDAGTGAD